MPGQAFDPVTEYQRSHTNGFGYLFRWAGRVLELLTQAFHLVDVMADFLSLHCYFRTCDTRPTPNILR
jgi:hypothetical protein